MNNRIFTAVLFTFLICFFSFLLVDNLRASNMLKKFCSLPVDTYTAIAMVEKHGYGAEEITSEYIVEKGTTDYIIIESLLIDLLESLQEGAPIPKRGELRGVGDIIIYTNKEKYYELDISYIGSLNAVYIRLSNEKNLLITMSYFIDIAKVDNFFNEFEKIKTQSEQVDTD